MLKLKPLPHSKRFPCWIRQSVKNNISIKETSMLLKDLELNTVCQSARCPNIHECFSKKKCTFLILGKFCTRNCAFCAIDTKKVGLERPDPTELLNIKEAVRRMGAKRVTITSVTRDDLEDGGAKHFAKAVEILRGFESLLHIEVLVPDFGGNRESIEKVVLAGPNVFSHNIETVPRLYGDIRKEADYDRSLGVIKQAKSTSPFITTKSGLMAGLGEDKEEIYNTMRDLKASGCDIIVIGQYLRPRSDSVEVKRFLAPEEFDEFAVMAKDIGFKDVISKPFARSSLEN
ncbi:MAG: lipoyl synthase [Candidatus Omnitrophota bacterium]